MNEQGSGRAADAVANELEARISAGQLLGGQRLPSERDLMAEFGTSRTVVREAVWLLSSRGLVDAAPRHRPVVREPGFDTAVNMVSGVVGHLLCQPGGVRNLFDTRILIEAALVRQAAKQASKEHIAALDFALKENGAAIEDSELFYKTDTAFHGVLFDIPNNPALPAIHKAYTVWLAPHWSAMPRRPERNRQNFQAHQAIFDAILMRDPDAAEAALRDHLDAAWAQVRQTFGETIG